MKTPIYAIAGWADRYENNRTRDLKTMAWVPVPNSHDGDGYTQLVCRENGAAYLGAWLAILQVASKCDPRGTLLRDGQKPHDAHSLSRMTRLPADILQAALDVCTHECNWLIIKEAHDGAGKPQEGAGLSHPPAGLSQEGAGIPHPSAKKGREGNERERTSRAAGADPLNHHETSKPTQPVSEPKVSIGEPSGVSELFGASEPASGVSVPSEAQKPPHGPARGQGSLLHAQLIEAWCQAYRAVRGVEYRVDGGRDGKAVKRLIGFSQNVDELMGMACRAWQKTGKDYFWCEKAVTIHAFADRYNEIRAELSNENRSALHQPSNRNSLIAGGDQPSDTADWVARQAEAHRARRVRLKGASPALGSVAEEVAEVGGVPPERAGGG